MSQLVPKVERHVAANRRLIVFPMNGPPIDRHQCSRRRGSQQCFHGSITPISEHFNDQEHYRPSGAPGRALIVMEGCGHAKFQEAVLDGVTPATLTSMTVPVFMSH